MIQRHSLRRVAHILHAASMRSQRPSFLRSCGTQQHQWVVDDDDISFADPPHRRFFSGWTGARGHDITGESLEWGDRPKVIVHSFAPSGFDVQNMVKRIDKTEESDGVVHMNGSILVFPFGCFLWKVESSADVTLESLAPILLHRPKLDYLFIGSNQGTVAELGRIQAAFRPYGIVVEKMGLSNAIGTFNILNAEDRQVAAALVLESGDE